MRAKKENTINFSAHQKKFCLVLQDNGANSYLFVNGVEIYKFKAKTGNKCYFSVDYDCIDIAHILDIHKFLMFKNNMK